MSESRENEHGWRAQFHRHRRDHVGHTFLVSRCRVRPIFNSLTSGAQIKGWQCGRFKRHQHLIGKRNGDS